MGQGQTYITIAQARKVAVGKAAYVIGRVTATNQFGSMAYIQDATGGIPVFNTAFANGVSIGDSVKVAGLIASFSSQIQIGSTSSIVDYTKINVPAKAVTPKVISITDAKNYEGQLVTIKDLDFDDKKFVLLPNANYATKNGTNTLEVKINATTNLIGRTKPQSAVTITGIVGLNNTTYQLQPRFTDDLPNTEVYKKPQTGLTAEKSFKLATWNTNWLGNTANGPTGELLQQKNFQQVLDSLKADIFVLEEVSNVKFFKDFISKYTNYKGFCSSAVSAGGVADDAQRVCFVYKKGVVDSVSARSLLTKATPLPNYPDNKPSNFWSSGRLPYLFVADVNINGVKKRLNFVGIHARTNTIGTTATTAEKELQYAQRKYDIGVLKDTLDAQFPTANVILIGDYNDDVDETVSEITSTKESSYKKFIDDTKNYQIVTKSLTDNGVRSYLSQNNVTDHITVSDELVNNYVANSVSTELGFMYIANYSATTSDHLPVYATFNFERDRVLGFEPKFEELAMNVYPNPTKGSITIEVEGNTFDYSLMNFSGNNLIESSGNFSEMNQSINEKLSILPLGMYFLRIQAGEKHGVLKIVKE
ncbi:putative secreted protein (Por secretion system target) [Arcicella aurantiaca]|uniref:Putative secreted protein (Por secretion system target) n=2 Tax=Arcicella aurantiaca TaxID=591202 RepID=A0A316EE85_9BACT|nr:putative secreted protein (Por secretion system target) [Arcicella aurantiaca]